MNKTITPADAEAWADAPAEELQAPGYCAANSSERTHRVIVGGVVVLLMVLAVVGFIARVLL